jgi:hypothetical protein
MHLLFLTRKGKEYPSNRIKKEREKDKALIIKLLNYGG